jgi:hypothetical protein
MINISLLLLIIAIIFITIGYTKQLTNTCDPDKLDIRLYSRNIYDELILNSEL